MKDQVAGCRGIMLGLLIMAVVIAAFLFVSVRGCSKADGATLLPAPLEALLVRLEAPGMLDWKRELVEQAIAHESKPFIARCLHYHPKEAGGDWRRWSKTATGTLVRPGVASCTQAYRKEWLGAWVWFEGVGIHHVEDSFPESGGRTVFDLASPERYSGQSYADWLCDPSRVVFARNVNERRLAVVLKPRNGWNQSSRIGKEQAQ